MIFTGGTAEFYDEGDGAGQRRVYLSREWGDLTKRLLAIGLNPSKAGAVEGDNTVAILCRIAEAWGYGALDLCNAFDLVSTDPRGLQAVDNPAGDPRNIDRIVSLASTAARILCFWGDGGALKNRSAFLMDALWPYRAKLVCLGRTKSGHPRHTRGVPADVQPVRMVAT